jgi:hypothetical protein
VQKEEVELLGLVRRIDRSIGTLEFLYGDKVLVMGQFEDQFRLLEERGWVIRNISDRWIISEAGEKALAESEDWEFIVEEVLRTIEPDSCVVIGTIRRGDVQDRDVCQIVRNGTDVDFGVVHSVNQVEDESGANRWSLAIQGARPRPFDSIRNHPGMLGR